MEGTVTFALLLEGNESHLSWIRSPPCVDPLCHPVDHRYAQPGEFSIQKGQREPQQPTYTVASPGSTAQQFSLEVCRSKHVDRPVVYGEESQGKAEAVNGKSRKEMGKKSGRS